MEPDIFIPLAKRLRAAAARLRRASDGSNDCGDWDTEANGLSALARRIEGYADALDPITARDERGGAKAR